MKTQSPQNLPGSGPDELLYKPDWPRARERFLALWEGEIIDRACIYVTAPRPDPAPLPVPPPGIEVKYTDINYVLASTNAEMRNTYYGGEAIPLARNRLGYAVFGGRLTFTETTIWVHPSISEWDNPYVFDPDPFYCRRYLELARAFCEDGPAQHKYLIETGGFNAPMDTLTMLRGTQDLCMDLLLRPAQVKAAREELTRAYLWLTDTSMAGVPADYGWVSRWMWAPGRVLLAACDFGALISCEQFAEFVLPEIEKIATHGDFCVYHLDGAAALHHVPLLLSLPNVHSIQWARGAKDIQHGTALRWVPLARQVQAAGKVFNIEVKFEEVEPLLRELEPRHLFIRTAAPSIEAADELLRRAARLCAGRCL